MRWRNSVATLFILMRIVRLGASRNVQLQEAPKAQGQSLSFPELVNDVKSSLSDLRSKVDAWSEFQGKAAATEIQVQFSEVLDQVATLHQQASTISRKEADPRQLAALATAISELLDAIKTKTTAFQKTGMNALVASDVRRLEQPAIDITNNVIETVKDDCSKLTQVIPIVNDMNAAFIATDKLYAIKNIQFPVIRACRSPPGHPEEELENANPSQAGMQPYKLVIDVQSERSQSHKNTKNFYTHSPAKGTAKISRSTFPSTQFYTISVKIVSTALSSTKGRNSTAIHKSSRITPTSIAGRTSVTRSSLGSRTFDSKTFTNKSSNATLGIQTSLQMSTASSDLSSISTDSPSSTPDDPDINIWPEMLNQSSHLRVERLSILVAVTAVVVQILF